MKRYVRDLEEALIRTLGAFEPRSRAVRGPDRRVDGSERRTGPEEDRVHRRPRVALGDDARLRAQRRSRPGAVHRVDHCVRARGRAVHDDGAASWSGRSASRTCAPPRSRRSPRSSSSSSTSSRPTTAPDSGRSRSTPRSRPDDRRHPSHPASRVGPAPLRGLRRSRWTRARPRGHLLRRGAPVLGARDDPRAPRRQRHDRRLPRGRGLHVGRRRDRAATRGPAGAVAARAFRTGSGRKTRP